MVSTAPTTVSKPTSGIKINEGGSSSGATGSEMVVHDPKDKGKGNIVVDDEELARNMELEIRQRAKQRSEKPMKR